MREYKIIKNGDKYYCKKSYLFGLLSLYVLEDFDFEDSFIRTIFGGVYTILGAFLNIALMIISPESIFTWISVLSFLVFTYFTYFPKRVNFTSLERVENYIQREINYSLRKDVEVKSYIVKKDEIEININK